MSRVKFYRSQQRYFLNRVAKYFDNDWSKVAKISNICERSLRDWRREKYNISYKALLKLHKVSHVAMPKITEILPEYWSAKKFARKGALRRMQLYGNLGTPEGRRKGGINSQRLFRLNPEYAREIGIIVRKIIKKPAYSEELAEFAGIMLGDGGITDYQINVTFNRETDSKYSVYVQKLIKKLFSISTFVLSRRLEKANRIVASSRNLIEFLERKGLKIGNKVKNQIDIPSWILSNRRYTVACLRGLIDTDGSFYQYRHRVNGKYYVNFSMCFTNHSIPLLNSVHEIIINLGISSGRSGHHVYIHRKEDIKNYFKIVGSNNPKHLERYHRYLAFNNMNLKRGVPNR